MTGKIILFIVSMISAGVGLWHLDNYAPSKYYYFIGCTLVMGGYGMGTALG